MNNDSGITPRIKILEIEIVNVSGERNSVNIPWVNGCILKTICSELTGIIETPDIYKFEPVVIIGELK